MNALGERPMIGYVRVNVPAALGYVRVSTKAQGESGLGLEAQRSAIGVSCAERRPHPWPLLAVEQDVASGKQLDGRPGLARALAALERGEYGALVVARLDRLSRSLGDFARIMELADRQGWTLVVLDPMFDMSTPSGKLLAHVSAAFAEFERALIAQRTREAITAAKANGTYRNRTPEVDGDALALILELRRDHGLSKLAIARHLNDAGIPAPRGDRWPESTIRKVLARAGVE